MTRPKGRPTSSRRARRAAEPRHQPRHREEQKQRTRQALLDAALELSEHESFSSLSLREVTREAGIVPTAFYRHFADMDELGLSLVEESFGPLRQLLRQARGEQMVPSQMIDRSVAMLIAHVHDHRGQFRFVVRERSSGVAALRHAIRRELRVIVGELAVDLARLPQLDGWTSDDLRMLADLLVTAMVSIVESLLEIPAGRTEDEAELAALGRKQLRLIMLGTPAWRSSP